MTTAAWTPDAPDAGTAESPSALIAAGIPAFDPEQLDHFEGVAVCGAQFTAVVPPSAQHPDVWQRITILCTDDAGHPEPHKGEFEWGASNTLPADPECKDCSDVGVTPKGIACTSCAAGDRFREAEALRAENLAARDDG